MSDAVVRQVIQRCCERFYACLPGTSSVSRSFKTPRLHRSGPVFSTCVSSLFVGLCGFLVDCKKTPFHHGADADDVMLVA